MVTPESDAHDVHTEFTRLAEPHRRELLAYCYRMVGSAHDAEDLVQEVYLRAWRAYAGFEGRAALRTWLYRIATRVCLTALEARRRRPLPAGLGGPTSDPERTADQRPDVPWLEPIPDAVLGLEASDPPTVAVSRETVRLALVAALQHLAPRQRAILIMRDVLRMPASDVARVMDMSAAAVGSVLYRARARLDRVAPRRDDIPAPAEEAQRRLLDQYVAAFESRDIAGLVQLLTSDVRWEMPPAATWLLGPDAVRRHLSAHCSAGPDALRLRPVGANGQPAFVFYLRDAGGAYLVVSLQVLTMTTRGISHAVSFSDPRVLAAFGLLQSSVVGHRARRLVGEHVGE